MTKQNIKTFRSTILIPFIVFFVLPVIGQYHPNNLSKYWYYRQRLTQYFTVVGTEPGQSMMMGMRNWQEAASSATGTSIVNHGEGIALLGQYIGVLATEYKMLSNNGQSVAETARELYSALYSFNRLDMLAESFLKFTNNPVTPSSATLNGFFVREDMPVDYFKPNKYYNHFNKNLAAPLSFAHGHQIPPPIPFSQPWNNGDPLWIDESNPAPKKFISTAIPTFPFFTVEVVGLNSFPDYYTGDMDEMSQDNVYQLMVGLALVVKCVPSTASYGGTLFQDSEAKFVKEAQNIMTRIMNWITQDPLWIIRNPKGNQVSGGGSPGGNGTTTLLSCALARAVKFIAPDYSIVKLALGFGECPAFIAIPSVVLDNDIAFKKDNRTMLLMLAAIGDLWGINNDTHEEIGDFSLKFKWGAYYLLLFDVLHPNTVSDPPLLPTAEDHLNFAPCTGPYFHSPTDKALSNWASPNRYFSDLDEQENGSKAGSTARNIGNFSGLDYMLLHNLYYLVAGDKDSKGNFLPFFQNLNDRVVSGVFPFVIYPPEPKPSGFGFAIPAPYPPKYYQQFTGKPAPSSYNLSIFSMTHPISIDAFKTITTPSTATFSTIVSADNSGNPDFIGNVTYHAGERIVIKPGFKVEKGAKFHAKVSQFHCVGAGYQRQVNPALANKAQVVKERIQYNDSSVYAFSMVWSEKNNFAPLEKNNPDKKQHGQADELRERIANLNKSAQTTSQPGNNQSQSGNATPAGASERSRTAASSSGVYIFPNPTTGKVAVSPHNTVGSSVNSIEIFSVLGARVYKSANDVISNSSITIDMAAWSKGVYFIKVQSGDEISVQKLVLE